MKYITYCLINCPQPPKWGYLKHYWISTPLQGGWRAPSRGLGGYSFVYRNLFMLLFGVLANSSL